MKSGKQRGFTLVEMLVALMIAGIFFSIFVGVVLATFETLRSGDERTVAQQNARVSLNYIANDIRHATEIAPLRLEAYKDWSTGGFPVDDNVEDPFFGTGVDAWPIYREGVDGDPKGYIDLDIEGGTGDGDEYAYFRSYLDDGMPYDVRALSPNRINLTFFGSSYFPNTEFWSGVGTSVDLDTSGTRIANATAGGVRVTYEHQLAPPFHPDIYEPAFSGLNKQFNMVVNRIDASSITDTMDFVVLRSFEMQNPTVSNPNIGETAVGSAAAGGALGSISDKIIIDEPYLRQPVADHVISMRFRYWYIKGNRMLEIRYDPEIDHIGGQTPSSDDGYYRYFDIYGHEMYVWNNFSASEMVPLLPTDFTQAEWDAVPPGSFYIDGGDAGDDEYQRGILLFEGWKFVNAISVTIKTANNRTLSIYRSTLNQNIDVPGSSDYDPNNPDYGMGFIDFGVGGKTTDASTTLNANEPLFRAADNMRRNTTIVNGRNVFDFVEPNMNPNYDASAFTTLQTLVVPPALVDKADLAIRRLRFGLSTAG